MRRMIADAVTLANYFIYGLSAFSINIEGQIAASDVNADGIPLSVADLVYLIRVITGDALPIEKETPLLTTEMFATQDGYIINNSIGAAAMGCVCRR